MARQPLRSFFVLLLLGIVLLTLALVVRSGILEVKTHDEPINATMREAMARQQPEMTTKEAEEVFREYPTAATTRDGLKFVVRRPGKGPKAQPGQEASVFYAGRLLDGSEFDSTYETGNPLKYTVGTGALIKGFDEAILDMRKGEKRTLIIPYWLGYGTKGLKPNVPPKATLIFEVELVDLQ